MGLYSAVIKVHVHVLSYGRAAQEVCEQALRGGSCFGHLKCGEVRGFRVVFFFSGSKSVARSSYAIRTGTLTLPLCAVD